MRKKRKGRRFLSSLRFKVLLVVLIAFVPAFALVIFTSLEQRDYAFESARRDAQGLSDLVAAEQNLLIEGARGLLTTLAQVPEVREGDLAACAEIFEGLIERAPPYDNITYIDAQGDILVSVMDITGPVNVADRPFFEQIKKSRDFVVAGYPVSRVSGDPILLFAYPLLDDAGAVGAVITTRVELDWLGGLALESGLPPGSAFVLVDGGGTVMARYPDPDEHVGESRLEEPLVQAIMESPQGGSLTVGGLDGVRRIYFFTPLGGVGEGSTAYVGVGFPESYVYSDANRALARNLAILGIITVMVAALAWAFGDVSVVARVKRLVETTRRLGEGDLGVRTDIPYGAGELGSLAASVDGMAESLQRRSDERNRAEESLRGSEERLTAIVETALVGITFVDADGNITFANAAAEEILGLERSEVAGRTYNDPAWNITGVDGEPFAEEELPFSRVMATGKEVRGVEHAIERLGGGRAVLSINAAPLHDAAGNISGMVASLIDVTEHKREEYEKSRKAAVLQAINSVFQRAFVAETEEEVAEACLDVALELTGSEFGFMGEISERGSFDTTAQSEMAWGACKLPHEDAVRLIRDMEIRGYWGRAMLVGETQIVNDPASDPDRSGTPEGHPEVRSFMGVPLKRGDETMGMIALANKRGEYTGADREDMEDLAVAFVEAILRRRDQDEIKALYLEMEQRVVERTAQLEAANRELEAFSYSVSHDLRTPLRAVDGFSQALLEDYYDQLDEQGRTFLKRVRNAAQRMAVLIDDMLTLSRVSRSEIRLREVDLSGLAEGIAAELAATAPGRGVEFSIEPGLTAKGDPNLLRLVLTNLLDNAFKFTGGCGEARIQFGAERVGGEEAFFVRDNGAGFDMNYAGKLFGVFQRLHSVDEFPGTGIGLATVQRVIHRHGGRAWGVGEEGEGATFYFTLPGA